MSIYFSIIKIAFYGIFGHLLFSTIDSEEKHKKNRYLLNYSFFALITVASETKEVLILAIGGIFWGTLLKIFFEAIDRSLTIEVNPLWFGLLNIFNCYVLENIFDYILYLIPKNMIVPFSMILTLYFLINISFTLRKAT